MKRIFITGGTGCIGATTIHQLLRQQVDEIVVVSRSSDMRLLQIWLGEALDPRVRFASANIGDGDAIRDLLSECQPSHILHLGALQSPDCDSHPLRGMEVNAGGTLNLFQAVNDLQIPLQRFVFASSAAVYGKRSMYAESTIAETAQLAPPNLYGVWKVAGEHLASLFHQQTGIPTVCLRLNTTYGPGRDRGKTSAPTRALKSLVLGASQKQTIHFAMPYEGRENYHYVEDVGAHFAGVTTLPFDGFGIYNIKGTTILVSDFLRLASESATAMGLGDFCELRIQSDASPNLFVCDLEDTAIDPSFPGMPKTPVADGIRKSLGIFQRMAAEGRLHME